MYIYISSQDSLEAYPHNNPHDFTVNLSQTIYTKGMSIGLKEICLTPKKVQKGGTLKKDLETSTSEVLHETGKTLHFPQDMGVQCDVHKDEDIYLYVFLDETMTSEMHTHRHSVMRMLSLKEFEGESNIVRFADVYYIPLKEHNLSHLTVSIHLAGSKTASCCRPCTNLLTGLTRCTFHVQE
jgi:hypothetical protein